MIGFQCNNQSVGLDGLYFGFIITACSLFIVEIIASWDEELGLKAIPEIFGLWVTESVANVRYFGGKSARSQAKLSSKPLAIVVPIVCVSSLQ